MPPKKSKKGSGSGTGTGTAENPASAGSKAVTSQERKQRIESYGGAYAHLVAALAEFPKAMWKFKPAPDRWSIHEILLHLADSEANSYIRARRLIAEPGKSVMAYDQEQWAEALHYHEQNAEEALELFRELRGMTYQLIKSLPDSVWANTVEHPEFGALSLDRWLEIYDQHIPGHIQQMKKNYEAWKKQQKK